MDLYVRESGHPDVEQPVELGADERPTPAEWERDEALDSLGASSLTIARLRRFINGPAAR